MVSAMFKGLRSLEIVSVSLPEDHPLVSSANKLVNFWEMKLSGMLKEKGSLRGHAWNQSIHRRISIEKTNDRINK